MSQADRNWAEETGESASLHATLDQQRDEFAEAADRRQPEWPEPRNALLLVPGANGIEPISTGEWSTAIKLVESAAAKIKAYERKFKAIEQDARAFMDRVDCEHQRLNAHIAALEEDLRKAENRALSAEAEAQAMKLETWEAKLSRRSVEKKLTDAEMEIRTSQKYLEQIEGILRGL